MNGPEHFREGEERMLASDYARQEAGDGDLATAMHEAAMAQAHFLAAIVTLIAEDKNPDSISWKKAIGR